MTLLYVSVEELKDDIGDDGTGNDDTYARCASDASRMIDRICDVDDGHFARVSATKYFDIEPVYGDVIGNYERFLARGGIRGTHHKLFVPPLLEVTTLKTDEDGDRTFETTWSDTRDYYLLPYDGPPYTEIDVDLDNGLYNFPAGQRTVEIVGYWGEETSVPGPIRRAAMILALRYVERPKQRLAMIEGSDRAVPIASADPDVYRILRDGRFLRGSVFA